MVLFAGPVEKQGNDPLQTADRAVPHNVPLIMSSMQVARVAQAL